jgi:hypothetical protein
MPALVLSSEYCRRTYVDRLDESSCLNLPMEPLRALACAFALSSHTILKFAFTPNLRLDATTGGKYETVAMPEAKDYTSSSTVKRTNSNQLQRRTKTKLEYR